MLLRSDIPPKNKRSFQLKKDADNEADGNRVVVITYTNHRGDTADRTLVPGNIWCGQTEWHPVNQWFLNA